MNWNKPMRFLKFELGFNKSKHPYMPQAQAAILESGRWLKFVLSNEIPSDQKDEAISTERPVAMFCVEEKTISEGPKSEVIVVRPIEVVRSGSACFRQGRPGFWWAQIKSPSGLDVHISVAEDDEIKPQSSDERWRFKIIKTARPLTENIPHHIVVQLLELVEEEEIPKIA
jgi:hypothetical protein